MAKRHHLQRAAAKGSKDAGIQMGAAGHRGHALTIKQKRGRKGRPAQTYRV
jgi:hypothetical protein